MDDMDYYERSLQLHALHKGKLETASKVPVRTQEDLSTVYAPGVAEPCMLIAQDPENARRYSIKANAVAVVSDGSSVLGLGNIGGLAALPVMESKAVLFKEFGGIDAFPICLDTQDTDEIVETVKNIAPAFGGINLEDISAPRCFEIEKRLNAELDIPVFHNDQHGTAIACGAAVINSFKLIGKPLQDVRALVCGAGVCGSAIVKMLFLLGIRDIVVCDSKGILNATRLPEFGEDKIELLEMTNKEGLSGDLAKAIKDRDLFIGASKPNIVTGAMIGSMKKHPVVFATANPEPEIPQDLALAAGARVVGTGKPDFPNQISNLLVFPGLFRGVLDIGATDVTEEMKIAAAYALAGLVSDEELSDEYILPSVFKDGVADALAKAVADAWHFT